ncbi:hypothetical protein ACR82P_000303 [Yersinia enterocolitica]|uniref:hypothetical protein n=1 Tax=Yersinia enterocolitica TaxID=630 RepID=UPI0030B79389|nr:hypothetical protein [Yersinia enterocolitica]EKN6081447.1 hypothetical protein [Yersinia enterocolitica]EKN6154007.1 hypothetical protein [Yersinia enterocolitica]
MDAIVYECDYLSANEAFSRYYSLYKIKNLDSPKKIVGKELRSHVLAMNAINGFYGERHTHLCFREDVVIRMITSRLVLHNRVDPVETALLLNYIGQILFLLRRDGGGEYVFVAYRYISSGFDVTELENWIDFCKQQKKNRTLSKNAKKGGDSRSAKLALVHSKIIELLTLKSNSGMRWKKKIHAYNAINKDLKKYIKEMDISLSEFNLPITVLNWSRDIESVKAIFALVVKKNVTKHNSDL